VLVDNYTEVCFSFERFPCPFGIIPEIFLKRFFFQIADLGLLLRDVKDTLRDAVFSFSNH